MRQSDLNFFIGVLPLVCVDPKYLNWSTSTAVPLQHMLEDGPGLMLLSRIFFVGGDFHAVSSSCFLKSFCELLEFFTASQQIDVISKLQVAKQSSTNGPRRQWRVSFVLHLLQSRCSPMDDEMSKTFALSFPVIYKIVLEMCEK